MDFRDYAQRMAVALSLVMMSTGVWAAPPAYRLHVDGLACPFCTYGIEKKLVAIPGVQGLETRIKDGTLIVTMKDGVALDEATARQAVKAAGFSLRRFEQVQPAQPGAPAGPPK